MLRREMVTADVCLAAAGERLDATGGGGGDTAEEAPLVLSASRVSLSLAESKEGGCESLAWGGCGEAVTSDGRLVEGRSRKRAAALVDVSDLERRKKRLFILSVKQFICMALNHNQRRLKASLYNQRKD